jgi:hypothetical protein
MKIIVIVFLLLIAQMVVGENTNNGEDIASLLGSITKNQNILNAIKADAGFIDYWHILNKAGRTGLINDYDAINAVKKIKINPEFANAGLTDDLLKTINGWGNANIKVGYTEIVNNIDRFITFLKNKNITCAECYKFYDIFKTGSSTDKQAIFWVLENIANDATTFSGKSLFREISVPKMPNTVFASTSGRIDVVVKKSGLDDLLLEYKWYGSGVVDESLCLDEFVTRDLFNITNLNNLQWRLKGNKLTKALVNQYLSSLRGKALLNILL